MMRHFCAILFLFLIGTSHAISADSSGTVQFPVEAKNEIIKKFPSLTNEGQFAQGDIDKDGLGDVVAIIQYLEGQVAMERIIVLKGAADGSYSLMSQSAPFEPHMRRNEYLSFKGSSIYITASSASYTDYAGNLYQFKKYADGIFLIGLEYSEGVIGDEPTRHVSANFLTNKSIESLKTGNKRKIIHRSLQQKYKIPLEKFTLGDTVDGYSLK